MFLRFLFASPLTLLVALHAYVGWQLFPALAGNLTMRLGLLAYLLLSFVLIPLAMQRRFVGDPRLRDRLAWVGFLAMGLFSSIFVLTLLRNVVIVVASWIPSFADTASWTYSALAVPALALIGTLVGLISARRGIRIEEVDVPIAGLDSALQGFSIVQISDVHVGSTIKREFVASIVERANALRPDVIAVTGDIVDGSVEQLAMDTQPLAELKARLGTFFVTGNHEYYSGVREWIREFKRLGMTVLNNEHVVVRQGGSEVVIAGVTDEGSSHYDPSHRSDPSAALRGAPVDAQVRILLAHRPSSAAAARAAGFNLQLSGHTHGGQFWPWNLFVGFFNPFAAGLNRSGDLWVYVNRGTGYWGPPNRLGIPPEITRIRLVAASARSERRPVFDPKSVSSELKYPGTTP